jgi:galactoside O-acetyltransferase
MGLLSRSAIEAMGFAAVGEDVRISDKASFYNCAQIRLGSHVRIDDFCVFSAGAGGIVLGDYIHVAAYSSMIGAGKIQLADFCNLSSRVAIYSSNDDYSGAHMTNPMVPAAYTCVTHGDVILEKHVIAGCGSVIVGPVRLEEGVALGALSLVTRDCAAFGIYAGAPAVRIKERARGLLDYEAAFNAALAKGEQG